jgi:hypothetical protein
MKFRSRLRKVAKHLGAGNAGAAPLTVVLRPATTGQPPGRLQRTNGAGLPVLEIVYDPASGPVELPSSPYKLVEGVDPMDLV